MTKLQLIVIQTDLPKYDIPLLERIACLDGIELTVLADIETERQLNQYKKGLDQFTAVHVGTV